MKPAFDGESFDPVQDLDRLASQLERVRALMKDGRWRPLAEIGLACGGTTASISARLRDLRKLRFGMNIVERRRLKDGSGVWMYRVLPPPTPGQLTLL